MESLISFLENSLSDPNQGVAASAEPMSLLGVERSPQLPDGFFSWIRAFCKLPDAYALRHQSLDSYLFIRFLRICCTICFVTLCVTWPILLPLNASGGNGKKQLDVFSYSNINIDDSTKRNRLYVHCFVAWIVYSFVIYTIMRECFFYTSLRQAFLLTPEYTKLPKEYLDKGRFYSLFNGSAKKIWIPGDTKELDRIIRERDKVALKLEKGEFKWIKLCNKERIKYEKKTGAKVEKAVTATSDPESGNLVAGWIADDQRPTHLNIIKTLPGLAWIQNIPQVILGAVSGLLPSIALSLLMSSVPAFMRICARRSGCVSLSQAELFTQKAYFSLVTILRNPTNVFSILSSSIPTASNFYISFFIVQGLAIATNVLTQVIGFITFT
ncbi:Calcium-dependent channel, 7TM region, putative phosphate [Fusarium oxysporum f. sp. vasinfectum]|nr:Calcium-dependent channel, 7TM region, putative phosphate [Fusarium oxysporum f. sp. vasinfectum]